MGNDYLNNLRSNQAASRNVLVTGFNKRQYIQSEVDSDAKKQ